MSSFLVEEKYIRLLSPMLPRFTKRGKLLWNFRCPICGDSEKNQNKARGYLYAGKKHMRFMCHNCHVSMGFSDLLKQLNPSLFREFLLETYADANSRVDHTETGISEKEYREFVKEEKKFPKPLEWKIPTVEFLSPFHPAKRYVNQRKIPISYWDKIYYAEDFAAFVKETFPEYNKDGSKKLFREARLVIPFFETTGELVGLTGRALNPNNEKKYINVKLVENANKMYGLDKVDPKRRIYIVEGPIDSMFLDNSVAAMDSALYKAEEVLYYREAGMTIVPDNEPRNKDIISVIKRSIDDGLDVCIWPKDIVQKDINEMIMNGYTNSDVMFIIDQNTYNGLRANMELNRWSKI